MKTAAVETAALCKTFLPAAGLFQKHQQPVKALERVDLRIEPGEIFVLLGPNGAGKTTLLKILCTLVAPDSGRASLFGSDVVLNPGTAKSWLSAALSGGEGFYERLTGRQAGLGAGILEEAVGLRRGEVAPEQARARVEQRVGDVVGVVVVGVPPPYQEVEAVACLRP